MIKPGTIDRTRLQALKISEIRSSVTEFNLYLDLGGEIVPYATGRHLWSLSEKEQLLQRGQYVLLYAREDSDRVHHYLASPSEESLTIPVGNDPAGLIVADAIAEFLKTRYVYPFDKSQFGTFKGLGLSLAQYLQAQSQLRELLWQLNRHDPYTFYHSARVAAYAVAMSIELDPGNQSRLWDLAVGSLLHDVGNLTLDTALLNHDGPLKDQEWDKVRHHPEESIRLLEGFSLGAKVREIILHHHERMDGGGYPHRLRSIQLPIEVRIVAMAEVFAALTNPRPYQSKRTPEQALFFIQSSLLTFLDPALLAPLQAMMGQDQVKQNQKAS